MKKVLANKSRGLDVLMLIKTKGLEYDDRLRKECLTLEKEFSVGISCVERDWNRAASKTVFDNIPVHAHYIFCRRFFRAGSGILLKGVETTLRLSLDLIRSRPRVAWIHNPDMLSIVFVALLLRRLGFINMVIWDHHELVELKGLFIMRLPIRYALNKVDKLVCTNKFRFKVLRRYLRANPRSVAFVENYPDKEVRDDKNRKVAENVLTWLDGNPFILAQGGGRRDRFHEELVSVCSASKIKLIIIGAVQNQMIDSDFVFYTGQITQKNIIPYTNRCLGSVVLYNRSTLNSQYCSPNRLFQAISLGKPVLVGKNPPMKKVVEKTGAGVVVDTDGRDISELQRGLRLFLKDIGRFKRNAEAWAGCFKWEDQEKDILCLVRRGC